MQCLTVYSYLYKTTCNFFYYFFKLFICLLFKFKFIYFNWSLITLQYCIGFAIQKHESATGVEGGGRGVQDE